MEIPVSRCESCHKWVPVGVTVCDRCVARRTELTLLRRLTGPERL